MKIYTAWSPFETQIYDQSCGDNQETDNDFGKNVGAGFIMDAEGKSLTLSTNSDVYWPNSDNDPDAFIDTVTEFGILSGHFALTQRTSGALCLGNERSFSLTLQREGSMVLEHPGIQMETRSRGEYGSVRVEMYDASQLTFSGLNIFWGGEFSVYDNARLNFFEEHVTPYTGLTKLYDTSEFNLSTNRIYASNSPEREWRISLADGSPQLNILAHTSGGDPLQTQNEAAPYPEAILDFGASSRGTIAIDMPDANAFMLTLLDSRKTFSVNGKPVYVGNSSQFNHSFQNGVQRNGFTTGVMTITKVR